MCKINFPTVTLLLTIFLLCTLSGNEAQNYWDYSKCFVTKPVCPNPYVRFFLYRRSTQNSPHELTLSDASTVTANHFDQSAPVVILIHGYTGNRDFDPNPQIRPAYFKHGEFNVISVDYQPLAPLPCYMTAVQNLKTVANCTAQLIDHMVSTGIFPMEKIHVIGFSLGGQTAGIIATYIKNGPLERITALDPAKPMFVFAPKQYKLDVGDAKFIDVMHTDVLQRGILAPSGHIDFYVNGGVEQRGCNIQKVMDPGACNHARAPEYYAESIDSDDGFWGFRCPHWYLYALGVCREDQTDSIALMGMHVNKSARGLYFLVTNWDKPYARGNNFTSNQHFVHPDPGDFVANITEAENSFLHKG